MDRTTLTIPADVRGRLLRLAAEQGVSMATIVREAIDAKLATARPRPTSLGTLPVYEGICPSGEPTFYLLTEAADYEVAQMMGLKLCAQACVWSRHR